MIQTFDRRGVVSIVELVIYIPSLLVSLYVCKRHGFRKSDGWVYLTIFCLARIIGSVCQLITYSSPSVGVLQAAMILGSIGLSPLLLANLGLVRRFATRIDLATSLPTQKLFRVIQISLLIGLILGIVGGTSTSYSSNNGVVPSPTSKASVALFVVAFLGTTALLGVSYATIAKATPQERRVAVGVTAALPFLFIRVLYSAISVFSSNPSFSIVGGHFGVYIGMAFIEEVAVVIIFLTLGFLLRDVRQADEEDEDMRWHP